jgi:hypothetical protein
MQARDISNDEDPFHLFNQCTVFEGLFAFKNMKLTYF